jgi:hypothetical protein
VEGRGVSLLADTAKFFDEISKDKLPGAFLFSRADG